MATAVYTKAKQAFLQALINLPADNIKAVFVDAQDYAVDLAAHEFLSDIPAGARVATSGNLANKSVTNGVFDADDITLAAVAGDQFEAIVVYQDTGNAATSRLLAYIDNATGLAFTPSGADVTIQWNNGANKIFALT